MTFAMWIIVVVLCSLNLAAVIWLIVDAWHERPEMRKK